MIRRHKISVHNLKSARVMSGCIVLQGACDERYYIMVDDWPELRDCINQVVQGQCVQSAGVVNFLWPDIIEDAEK